LGFLGCWFAKIELNTSQEFNPYQGFLLKKKGIILEILERSESIKSLFWTISKGGPKTENEVDLRRVCPVQAGGFSLKKSVFGWINQ